MTAAGPEQFQSAELADAVARARAAPDLYAGDVLRSNLLSAGLYIVPAGGVDDQTPHDEDEVYYVVSGLATLDVEGHEQSVKPGSLLFVPARAVHHFHDVEQELVLVVFWAPPEGTVTAQPEVDR